MKRCFTLTIRALVIGLFCYTSTNVSAQTPTLVYDINSGMDPSLPTYLTPFNGKLYFAADDGSTGQELWVYDGINNPSRVADINSGTTGSDPQALTVFNNKLYFVADNGTTGRELWSYDGSTSPSIVTDLNSGSNWGFVSFEPEMIVYNNALYFSATNGTSGMELYKYTGTGTPTLVYDIYSGGTGSNIGYFCIYKDTLFFRADDGVKGDELWRYTGAGNPSLVYDIRSGATPSVPNYLTVYNNKLYFSADEGTNGIELWSYDNVNNPSIAADINSGSSGSVPSELIVYKNKLYFSADDGTTGLELYSFNGTTASLVEDIYTGTFNASFPTDFCVYNDTLYFAASDGTSGLELRKYGGSGSVQLVADIASGSSGSFPEYPVVFGGSLYFQADDAVKGAELWRITGPCAPIQDTLTVSACDIYVFNGNTYFTNNNTAKDTIVVTGGCDTIVTLNLTIKNSSFPVDSIINACDSFTLFGITYHDSAIVDTVLMNSVGCDSLVTFYIAINQPTNRDTFVNSCNNFTWRGTTYSNSTTVVHTLPTPNSQGCDSTVTLHFTKGQTTFSYKQEETCNEYFWRGTTYTNSGLYSDTIPNSNGCDSILVLNLIINKTTTTDTFATSCGVYTWRGNTIFGGGILYDSLVSSKGCDSIVTLSVTATDPVYNSINIVQCDSADVNGTWYKDNGTYTQTLTAASGCDSILTINYAKQFGRDTMVITECKKYNINSVDYTSSGLYNIGVVGCDTTVLDLTIHDDADTTELTWDICSQYAYRKYEWKTATDSGFKSIYGGEGYYSTTYVNIPREAMCDSVIKINAKGLRRPSYPIPGGHLYTCDSITFWGVTYNEESYREKVKENSSKSSWPYYGVGGEKYEYSGCYSWAYYTVTFNKSVTINNNVMSCQPILVGDTTFTNTGEYTVRLETQNGCDSVINVNYTHLNKDTTITKDVCDSYELNGITYTQSGTYKQPVKGCEQDTITLNLTIRQSSATVTDTITACGSYTWEGETYTQSTQKTVTYANVAGCDSVRNLILTIKKPIIITDTVEACGSFIWRGTTYTVGGTYNDTLTAANGCDSIRRIILEIKDINIYPDIANTGLSRERGTGWGVVYQNNAMGISNNGEYIVEMSFSSVSGIIGIETYVSAIISKFENDEWVEHGYDYFKLTSSYKKGEFLDKDVNLHVTISDDGNTFAVVYKNYFIDHTDPDENKHKSIQRTTVAVYTVSGDSLKLKGAPIYLSMYNAYTNIDLSADGNTLVIGYPYELGFSNSGATVFEFNGFFWLPKGSPMQASFLGRKKGVDVDLMPDGDRVVVTGATTVNTLSGDTIQGDVIVYDWDGSSWKVFGHSIINILTEGLVPGKPHDIFASAAPDTNILAVTRAGSDKILIYRYNSSSFTWEVTDTIKMEYAVDGIVNLQISNDAKIVTVSSHNDKYSNATLFSEVYVYDSAKYIASEKVNLSRFQLPSGQDNDDEEPILQRSSLRLAPAANKITFILPEIEENGYTSYTVKTYQFCDDDLVGIKEVNYNTTAQGVNFTVYPNPSTGVFTLRVDVPDNMKDKPMEYEIYNIQGMVVGRGKLNGAEGTIALEGQPQGIYFVRFLIGNYTGTAKIMIQH